MQPSASPTRLRIEFAQASDPGRDPNKQENEDSCGYSESRFGHLCVLCDGMGGHHGGKEASRLAITTIFEVIEHAGDGDLPRQVLKTAIEEAARRVYALGGPPDNRARPGSTVVAMLLHDRGAEIAHVGDSRAFVIRGNKIYPLTRDHSMVQGMIDAGVLTEAQAIGHPDANKITRALGMRPDVEVEVRPESMELFAGDILLQVSDGVTDLALSADILGATRQALNSGSVAHACQQLIQLANDRGGHDNITVQIVRVQESGGASLTIPEAPAPPAPTRRGLPEGVGPTMTSTLALEPPSSRRNAGSAPARPTPTAVDDHGPPRSARGGVSPTVAERQDPVWTSGQYASPVATGGGTALGAAFPMPPGNVIHATTTNGRRRIPARDGNAVRPLPGVSVATMTAPTTPDRSPAAFIVIGLSAFVAILIVLLLWALFLR